MAAATITVDINNVAGFSAVANVTPYAVYNDNERYEGTVSESGSTYTLTFNNLPLGLYNVYVLDS